MSYNPFAPKPIDIGASTRRVLDARDALRRAQEDEKNEKFERILTAQKEVIPHQVEVESLKRQINMSSYPERSILIEQKTQLELKIMNILREAGAPQRYSQYNDKPRYNYNDETTWPDYPCPPGLEGTRKGCRVPCYQQGKYGDLIRKKGRCRIPPGASRMF